MPIKQRTRKNNIAVSKAKKKKRCCVYILETARGQLYTGITSDLERRMHEHKGGRGGKFTRVFGFKELLFSKTFSSRSLAAQWEARIKTWPRRKKLEFIQGKSV